MSYSFVFFSYSSEIVHRRAVLAVLSLVNCYQLKNNDKLVIYTDNKKFFDTFLKNIPVEYVPISEVDVKLMMGNDDLIHRVKIGIIEQTMLKYPNNNLLYADSDTFFLKPLTDFLQKITPTHSLMHKFEFDFKEIDAPIDIQKKTDITQEYCHLFHQFEFQIDNEIVKIKPDFSSWNAGMIGLHHQNKAFLKAVYQLTDQTYGKVKHHAAEQFAFSYILQTRTQLSDCEDYNRHYWHQIEKQIADELLVKKLDDSFQKLSLEEKLKQAKQMCDYLYKTFPIHEYTHRYNAMIAFSEGKYAKGYKEVLLTLLRNPLQKVSFFKDVAYYIKKIFINK
jgi:hypothetical protein